MERGVRVLKGNAEGTYKTNCKHAVASRCQHKLFRLAQERSKLVLLGQLKKDPGTEVLNYSGAAGNGMIN